MSRKKQSIKTIEQLLQIYKNKCAKCKKDLSEIEFHIDHIKSLSLGGSNFINNLQPLCIECHRKKTKEEGFNVLIGKDGEYIICKKCNRIIRGTSKKNVDLLIQQHLIGCDVTREDKRVQGYLQNLHARENKKLKEAKCIKCPKIIEGFTQKHVDTLMAQHMIKHQNEENANKVAPRTLPAPKEDKNGK